MRTTDRRSFLKNGGLALGAGALTLGAGRLNGDTGTERPLPPSGRFLEAVRRGDREAVLRWLDTDPGLIHTRDRTGRSAFALALLEHQGEIAVLLRERGHVVDLHEAALALDWERLDELATTAPGSINRDHPIGGTAMFAAAIGGAGTQIWRVYRHNGDPNAAPRGKSGQTALRAAFDHPELGIAEMTAATLLANGADPNQPQPEGSSPLHAAAARGSAALVDYLVCKGARVNAADAAGRTPRALAEASAQRSTAALLRRHDEIPRAHSTSRAAFDVEGRPYAAPDLSAFAATERLGVVGAAHRELDQVRQSVGRHPELAHAVATTTERAVEAGAHMGRTDIVDYLLEHGAPYSLATATMRNDRARMAALLDADPLRIHERGAHDFPLLWYSVIGESSTETARLLLERGADVDRQHWMGGTTLHWAAAGGDVEMIELLLDHGADIDRVSRKFDAAGETPLQRAIVRKKDAAIRLLQARGARG